MYISLCDGKPSLVVQTSFLVWKKGTKNFINLNTCCIKELVWQNSLYSIITICNFKQHCCTHTQVQWQNTATWYPFSNSAHTHMYTHALYTKWVQGMEHGSKGDKITKWEERSFQWSYLKKLTEEAWHTEWGSWLPVDEVWYSGRRKNVDHWTLCQRMGTRNVLKTS